VSELMQEHALIRSPHTVLVVPIVNSDSEVR